MRKRVKLKLVGETPVPRVKDEKVLRSKTSFYLDQKLLGEFQEMVEAENKVAGRVLESLMHEYVTARVD